MRRRCLVLPYPVHERGPLAKTCMKYWFVQKGMIHRAWIYQISMHMGKEEPIRYCSKRVNKCAAREHRTPSSVFVWHITLSRESTLFLVLL